MADKDAMASGDVTASPDVAVEQQSASDWPRPGAEGYVHPDGTPQSQRQLEDNRRAAADRAAAGSTVHGAPLATPGPDPEGERVKAEKRAEEYGGTTVAEARDGQAEFVATALDEGFRSADERAAADAEARETARGETKAARVSGADSTRTAAAKATSRTAADSRPTEKR